MHLADLIRHLAVLIMTKPRTSRSDTYIQQFRPPIKIYHANCTLFGAARIISIPGHGMASALHAHMHPDLGQSTYVTRQLKQAACEYAAAPVPVYMYIWVFTSESDDR